MKIPSIPIASFSSTIIASSKKCIALLNTFLHFHLMLDLKLLLFSQTPTDKLGPEINYTKSLVQKLNKYQSHNDLLLKKIKRYEERFTELENEVRVLKVREILIQTSIDYCKAAKFGLV